MSPVGREVSLYIGLTGKEETAASLTNFTMNEMW
jgi:hypothetical protein